MDFPDARDVYTAVINRDLLKDLWAKTPKWVVSEPGESPTEKRLRMFAFVCLHISPAICEPHPS